MSKKPAATSTAIPGLDINTIAASAAAIAQAVDRVAQRDIALMKAKPEYADVLLDRAKRTEEFFKPFHDLVKRLQDSLPE